MIPRIAELPVEPAAVPEPGGLGTLTTEHGNLPLRGLDVDCHVTGLGVRTVVTQRFANPHPEPIEATYIFPLPDRHAVTDMTMTVADRTVTAELQERAQARQHYDTAVAQGKRAAIAEAERADVFTMRVGNLQPGEEAEVSLTLLGPLSYEDGEATLRVPLVVAPRYIPGDPLGTPPVGAGHAPDTDAVPDASRITPPVLLPGFPNPVALSIAVTIDPAGLPLRGLRSSLHTVTTTETDTATAIRVEPGERVDRDFILRFDYGTTDIATSLITVPDPDNPGEGTFQLTALPPTDTPAQRPRDVVVLLDRSGSMGGWKMVAARRAAARIVDTLDSADHFAVRCFDTRLTAPEGLPLDALSPATDRNRFRAVEHLAATDSRGGTDILTPLTTAVDLLATGAKGRQRVIVLVTDGQVGNEDQILGELTGRLSGTRVHVVGIDRAVNAGFLHRLALTGRGRCELVESEDRLDAATAHIHRRIVAPVITDPALTAVDGELVPETLTPHRIPDLFTGAPLRLSGRYRGATTAPRLTLTGTRPDGTRWTTEPTVQPTDTPTVPATWARAHLRDLEDQYAAAPRGTDLTELEQRIVAVSLRHRVLSRFTAFVAVDTRVVTEPGHQPRTVVQPVELPQGWQPPTTAAPAAGGNFHLMAAPAAMESYGAVPPPGAPSPAFGAPAPQAPSGAPPAPGGPNVAARPMARAAGPRFGKSAREPKPLFTQEQLRQILHDEWRILDPEVHTMEFKEPAVVERERRAALSDLATRLTVVLTAITELGGFDTDAVTRLRELVPAMESCEHPDPPTGDALAQLWTRTVELLKALASQEGSAAGPSAEGSASASGSSASASSAETEPASAPPSETGPEPKQVPFWKR